MPGPYATAVLADNPLHYWRCNDPGGPLLFDIGSSPIIEYQDSANGLTGFTGPNLDGGSLFTNGHEWKSASTFNLVQPYTLEAIAWLAIPNSNVEFFQAGAQIGVDGSQHVLATTPGSALTTLTTWPLESWHHIAFSCTAGARTLYFDGSAIAADGVTGAARNDVIYVGGIPGSASNWFGFVSEVAFYSTALGAPRIAAHHAAIDNGSSIPQFILNGTPGVAPNPPLLNTTLLQQIYNAVHRVFPTT